MAVLLSLLLLIGPQQSEKLRVFQYNGSNVKTTFDVEDRFFGMYEGAKSGFLELKRDGNGIYRYDVFGFALEGCKKEAIQMEWGFLIDEDGKVVSFKREYGYSYPILMRSVSEVSFKGCREKVFLDFITDKEGTLGVSSSDDWEK